MTLIDQIYKPENKAYRWDVFQPTIEVLLHVLTWSFICVFIQVTMLHEIEDFCIRRAIVLMGAPLALAFVFYANYLYLVPRYITQEWGEEFESNIRRFIQWNALIILLALVIHISWIELIPWLFFPDEPLLGAPAKPNHLLISLRDLFLFSFTMALGIFIRVSRRYWFAQQARLQAEKRMLLSQTSPHFLLNTLNNIYALVQFDPQRAQQTIHQLSRLLNYVLYETQEETTTLQREVDFIDSYVQLMKLRFNSNVSVSFEAQLGRFGQVAIAPMLLQPLIENAFKHGVTNERPCQVSIHLNVTEERLRLVIVNSMNPKPKSDRAGHGIGTRLTRQRLKMLYPGRHEFTLQPSQDGSDFLTTLTIYALNKQ